LLIALGAFGVWSWGLLHEEDIEEELALFVGSKEQLPYFICRRDFILEEGACHLLTVFLPGEVSSHQNSEMTVA
jgi:hypothetical protein